jgi:hypothetical protein
MLFITAYGGFLYEPLAVQALAFGVAAASFVGGIALTLTAVSCRYRGGEWW